MRDGCCSVVDPYLIAVGVVAMMMCVKRKANGLLSDCAYLGENSLRAGWEIRVDHEDIVLEHDPSVVAVAVTFNVALVKVHVACDRIDLIYSGGAPVLSVSRIQCGGNCRSHQYAASGHIAHG